MRDKQDPIVAFEAEKKERIAGYQDDAEWQQLSREWLRHAFQNKYMYNFSWMGRPVIQTPIDLMAMQELIWEVRPQLIVETGVAHGGTLLFYASLLELLGEGEVLGVDIEIRPHNRQAIEAHPMSRRVRLIEGSSTAAATIDQIRQHVDGKERVMVCLDSNHTEAHVIDELTRYADMVTVGSYLVVFDSVVEDLPKGFFADRPWDVGNNPKTAIRRWLASHPEFEIDRTFESKLLLTVCPDGFLKRVR